MKKLMSLLLAGLLLVTTAATAAAPYANNRAPLREKPFVKLPLGAIREPVRREEAKVGRNDPCPCGSGRKYKKCHGAH